MFVPSGEVLAPGQNFSSDDSSDDDAAAASAAAEAAAAGAGAMDTSGGSGAGGMAAHAAEAHDPSAGYSPLDGFDFRFHDQIGPAAGHGARLVASFSLRLAGTLYGMHQCVKVRCTRDARVLSLRPPFAFVESREDRATLLLATGRLVLQTAEGTCCVYDMGLAMWSKYSFSVRLPFRQWQQARMWLALPWQTARIVVRNFSQSHSPVVCAMFEYDHLIAPHQQEGNFKNVPSLRSRGQEHSHSLLHIPSVAPLPFIMRRLLRGLRHLPAEERWRQRAVAVLLALHDRVGKDSPIRVLLPDTLRRIMLLEHMALDGAPEMIGGGGPTPTVKALTP